MFGHGCFFQSDRAGRAHWLPKKFFKKKSANEKSPYRAFEKKNILEELFFFIQKILGDAPKELKKSLSKNIQTKK